MRRDGRVKRPHRVPLYGRGGRYPARGGAVSGGRNGSDDERLVFPSVPGQGARRGDGLEGGLRARSDWEAYSRESTVRRSAWDAGDVRSGSSLVALLADRRIHSGTLIAGGHRWREMAEAPGLLD